MCGICGIVDERDSVDRGVLQAMTETLRHRGPDESGLWLKDGVGLGHQRLAIIDLAAGQQPMASDNGRYHLVFNGEIYNFKEIRQELINEGFTPRTQSDTEIILLAYQCWGIDCLSRFMGMFAIAIWDREMKKLFLARDHLGQKPLHYFLGDRVYLFASEIKSLLCHPQVSRELDRNALGKYLAYDYIPAPSTIFKKIKKLMPGTYAIWQRGDFTERAYWQNSFKPQPYGCEGDLLDEIDFRLRRSVRQHLESDVPLGVFLSGGIDSSSIVAYMAEEISADRIETFNIRFDEPSFDEGQYAQQVAKHFSTNHHEEVLSPEKALELVPNITDFLDEPFADPSIIPTFLLSQMTRKSVKVALGGDGGDEVFVGYENYRAAKYARYYLKVPKLMRRGVFEKMIQKVPSSDGNLTLDYKLKRFVRGIDFPPPVNNYVWLGSLTPSEQGKIFQQEFLKSMAPRSVESIYSEVMPFQGREYGAETMNGLLESDLRLYLQDDILVKVDRASMANSLEVRSPFLDHRLVP